MLHEILLSLSGIPSPLWAKVNNGGNEEKESIDNHVSAAEYAILADLTRLGQIHAQIKDHVVAIQANHYSPICRAVGFRVSDVHLGAFRAKLLAVEDAILRKDAAYVGAYQIVPLSTLVSEFRPWLRRMEWLFKVTEHVVTGGFETAANGNSGPALLAYLDAETHTGFVEIQDMAIDLLTAAQSTWMRSASTWLLYGQLPSFGEDDFMVREPYTAGVNTQHTLDNELVPYFVTSACANGFLGVGNALNQIRRQHKSGGTATTPDVAIRLLPTHLNLLATLTLPLNPVLLESAVTSINRSISQNALSQLLPLESVLEISRIIQDYVLLGRGEFAVVLINNVDNKFASRLQSQASSVPVRKLGKMEALSVKASELDAVLAKTWSDLAALQNESETEEKAFNLARQLLKFSALQVSADSQMDDIIATLTPDPVLLHIDVPADSALNVLITHIEATKYAHINSHLLSIRRAEMRLSGLWKLTGHRRCHPAPLAPPMSATPYGRQALAQRRKREDKRSARLRKHWSAMSNVLFFINELGAYLQGEVIRNSWLKFHDWLCATPSSRPAMVNGLPSRPSSRSSDDSVSQPRLGETDISQIQTGEKAKAKDPRTIAQAHQTYLATLYSALLIDKQSFCRTIKSLLLLIDHFGALFTRLQTVWQGLDLQEDDGIMDAFVNFAQDEKDILTEMDRSRDEVEGILKQLVQDLKDIEKGKDISGAGRGMLTTGVTSRNEDGGFVPFRARTLDRLIMKLDFLQGGSVDEETGLVEQFQDALE